MADVYQYVTPTGVIVPDTSNILSNTQAEYQAVLGTDLIVTSDTPQGVLIVAETASRTEVVNNNAAVANQINPNIAGGVFLDDIMALMGVERIAATKSVISAVLLSGVAGTTIPAGTQAQSSAGDVFESLSTVVIDVGGTVTVDFASVVTGPVQCPENTLIQVVTNITGWETVINPNAAVVGATTQSDQSARAYRDNTLGFQGNSLAVCITSALYKVDGVTSLTFRENYTKVDATIDGIFLLANSIWACVNGGADLDIAAALLENKSDGSNWNGAVTVNVVEPASGQTYPVKFDRPDAVPILVRVTTTNGNSVDIKSAILAYVASQINGLQGFVVGSDVSPSELAISIGTLYPGTFLTKVEITLASAPTSWTTDIIAIALDEIATTAAASITVVNV